MVRAAGISLDRALFPLLVVIERRGPIGVVDLADRVGRDYTTVSRQVAKLEGLGLVERQAAAADRRVSHASVTAKGKAMTDEGAAGNGPRRSRSCLRPVTIPRQPKAATGSSLIRQTLLAGSPFCLRR
jgi:DNA-binding MarR family transcriptional regulator